MAIGIIGCSESKVDSNTDPIIGIDTVVTDEVKNQESDLITFNLGEITAKVKLIEKSEFEKIFIPKPSEDEAKNLYKDSLKVTRIQDTLIFKLNNGENAYLINDDSDDDSKYGQYHYLGTIDNLNHFIVYGAFYEWHNYLLIDMESGDTNYLAGFPILSPDKKTIISGNCDLVAGFTFNGLELYSNTNPINKISSIELMEWGPEEIKWIDNSILLIKGYVSDTSMDNLRRLEYFKIEFK
ncbi:MAG: hypothetical protein RQ875_07255 [Vicingaceae bacterium]|nr:hypothetical protein [Vicingaceae bacterium]